MLKEIITKWLGEEKDEIKLIGDVGHNALIQDLKSRIPELEEMIEKEIRGEVLEEMLQSTIVAPDLYTLKTWIRKEQEVLKNHTPQGGKD